MLAYESRLMSRHREPYSDSDRTRCLTCPRVLPRRCRYLDCFICRNARFKRERRANAKLSPMADRPIVHPTHVAGYVPPAGSIAFHLLGHVVKYA